MATLRSVRSAPGRLLLPVATFGLLTAGVHPCRGAVDTPTALFEAGPFIGVSVGIDDFHVKDEYLSPYIQRGRLASASAVFELKQRRTRHRLELGGSSGGLRSDRGNSAAATAHVGALSYSLLRSVAGTRLAGQPIDFSLGGGVSSFVSYNTFGVPAGTSWYGADEAWYWSHALDLQLRAEYRPRATRSVSFGLTAPVARIVSRPDNGHHYSPRNVFIQHESFWSAARGGAAELLWDNLVLRCELEYRERLGARLALRASYGFAVLSSQVPLPMRTYRNRLQLGLLWRP